MVVGFSGSRGGVHPSAVERMEMNLREAMTDHNVTRRIASVVTHREPTSVQSLAHQHVPRTLGPSHLPITAFNSGSSQSLR